MISSKNVGDLLKGRPTTVGHIHQGLTKVMLLHLLKLLPSLRQSLLGVTSEDVEDGLHQGKVEKRVLRFVLIPGQIILIIPEDLADGDELALALFQTAVEVSQES